MRLLQHDEDGEFIITVFDDNDLPPPYAILSHTWGADEEEVTLADIVNGGGRTKPGYEKIRFCGKQARQDGLEHFWIDTCCIDKVNKAEIAVAIRSMFCWYRNAARCYVYLSDVPSLPSVVSQGHYNFRWLTWIWMFPLLSYLLGWYNSTIQRFFQSRHVSCPPMDSDIVCSQQKSQSEIQKSRWFTRGWTLQELLAPSIVEFFSKEGVKLGDKLSLTQELRKVTGIPSSALHGTPLSDFGVLERISWGEHRTTKIPADWAYSLMGILGVSLPPIDGESPAEAMKRVRDEVEKQNQCIRDLRLSNPRDDKKRIEETKGGLLADSYRWVLDNNTFQQWQQDPDSRLLWVKGDPGKGKTMLLCGIINELPHSMPKGALLLYFFCQATDSNINSATAVLRGLLYMLVHQQPSLVSHIRKKHDHAGKGLFEDANAWVALTEIFADMLRDVSLGPTYLIIDALDELKKLASFPSGLDSLYTRMMQQMSESDDAEICRCVLASTAILYRPVTISELVALVEQLENLDDLESVRKIVGFCGSFLTLREDTVYFVRQSAKDFLFTKAYNEAFPAGSEAFHQTIFSRSLASLSKTLHRNMYSLEAPGYPIENVELPETDTLAVLRYPCVYWIDHLYESKALRGSVGGLQAADVVDAFLRKKYLYWLEGLSLCRSVEKGVVSIEKLWSLVQICRTRSTCL